MIAYLKAQHDQQEELRKMLERFLAWRSSRTMRQEAMEDAEIMNTIIHLPHNPVLLKKAKTIEVIEISD